MTVLFSNNAASKLAAGIDSVATTVTVAAGEGVRFPSPTGGDWFPVVLQRKANYTDIEIARCTARSVDTLTIVRAQEGTSALTFVAGDIIDLRLTAAALAEKANAIKHNLSATTNPTVVDDEGDGYQVTSRWVNTVTAELWVCLNATAGAANWQQATLTLDELGSAAVADIGTTSTNVPDIGIADARYLGISAKAVDSDKLNGQLASFYRNAGNLNAGILPAARFNDTAHGNRGGGSLHSAASTTVAGFMAAADKSKLNGIEAGAQVNVATNLGQSRSATTYTVTSSTGTNTVLAAATGTLAGVMAATDKSKLDLVGTNANRNLTISTSAPSGGANGDVWYQYE